MEEKGGRRDYFIFSPSPFFTLAFILAAKGLARMKQLEDRPFAEYMLIGTLISALSAIEKMGTERLNFNQPPIFAVSPSSFVQT